ncbi:MAG: DUF456 domain-containing protein, partial [Flavobacteriales bacterium]|nr:DUF456 domain-containing protein [Flavobacteriales bacterium]
MDIVLIILSLVFVIFGIIGCFMPIIPGPPISWLAMLMLYFTENTEIDSTTLFTWMLITIIVLALDYLMPIWGTEKFGGTKMGVNGSMIGLLVGVFFPPFGIIIGPFLGAFIAELIHDAHDTRKAFKSA